MIVNMYMVRFTCILTPTLARTEPVHNCGISFIADNAVCNGVASWKGPTAMQMEMRVQIMKRPMREETGSKSCPNSSLTLT